MHVSFLYLEKLQCVSTPWGAENEPPYGKTPFMVIFPCEGHTLNYGNDTGGKPEWLQKHVWLQKIYLSPYSEILYLSKPIAYWWHAKRLPKIQTSLPSFAWCWLSYCSSILHCYLPQGNTLWTFNIHLGYAELYPNPKAQSRWYQLGAMEHGPFPWTLSWAAGSRWPCLSRRVGPGDLQRSLLTSATLWLCGSVVCREPMV